MHTQLAKHNVLLCQMMPQCAKGEKIKQFCPVDPVFQKLELQ